MEDEGSKKTGSSFLEERSRTNTHGLSEQTGLFGTTRGGQWSRGLEAELARRASDGQRRRLAPFLERNRNSSMQGRKSETCIQVRSGAARRTKGKGSSTNQDRRGRGDGGICPRQTTDGTRRYFGGSANTVA